MMNMYYISNPENKTDMLPENDAGLVCHTCSMPLKDDYLNPEYKASKRFPDLSHTYDGHRIVSQRFRDTVLSVHYEGMRFDELSLSAGFFRLRIERVLRFSRPPGLKFEELCPECGRYKSVWGLNHVRVLLPPSGISEGIYRSDIKMGYGRMMFYCLIATEEAKKVLKHAKLRGLSFQMMAVDFI